MRYEFHANHLGSTTFVTDQTQTGATIQKTLYYSWGQLWASSALVKDNRFASMDQRDAETGNDPTLFRLYNPRLYRWLSPDPLAGDISNPQSLNRYAYVLNNPTNFIDPLGLQGGIWAGDCSEPWYSASHAECPDPPPCIAPGACRPPVPFPPVTAAKAGTATTQVETLRPPGRRSSLRSICLTSFSSPRPSWFLRRRLAWRRYVAHWRRFARLWSPGLSRVQR